MWKWPSPRRRPERRGSIMKASHLACKGCGATYPLEALFACDRCFGPLEVGFDESRARLARAHRGRAADAVAVRRLPARGAAARGLPVGCSPLIRADRLAAELGLDCELYIKTETSNPTHSFKDRVVAVAAAKAVELGYEALACASTGNLAGATAAAGGRARPADLHLRPGRPRAREDHRRGRLRRHGVRGRRLLRRREPALLGAGIRAALGVRQRQHARLLRRGVKDDRARDRRAARLARARPGRGADRLGLALHQDPAGLRAGPRGRA